MLSSSVILQDIRHNKRHETLLQRGVHGDVTNSDAAESLGPISTSVEEQPSRELQGLHKSTVCLPTSDLTSKRKHEKPQMNKTLRCLRCTKLQMDHHYQLYQSLVSREV